MGQVPAGSLNKRIVIERKELSQNDWGQPAESWVTYASVRASFKTVTGMRFVNNEQFAGGTEIGMATTSIRIRKRTDITSAMRVRHRGRIFDIREVLPDNAGNEFTDLAVSTGASEG
jgi:SPP1 family predicted phage head-tail adaptor